MDRPEERLALIETLGRDGRPGRGVDVWAWPLAIGRALGNHLVIDDPHVAPRHLRIDIDAQGQLQLTVLETRNGAVLDGRRLVSGAVVPLPPGGATLQLGETRLRLRLPDEVLPAEQALQPDRHRVWLLTVPLAALVAAEHAIGLDPGAEVGSWLPLILLPLGLAGWCAAWALLSKVFRHQFDFAGHLRIAIVWLLATQLASALLPQLAASFGWPGLWRAAAPLQLLLSAAWIGHHLVQVLPHHRRTVLAVVAAATLTGSVVALTLSYRKNDSFSSAPYMSTLPMPALRLSGTVPPALLVDDMSSLVEPLARRVEKAREEEERDSRDGED